MLTWVLILNCTWSIGPGTSGGYAGNVIILICISVCHGCCSYAWVKDGQTTVLLDLRCILAVNSPGSYCCIVTKSNEPTISQVSAVVTVIEDGGTLTVLPNDDSSNVYTLMDSEMSEMT